MFLHLGNDRVVRADEIVAVFDMDNTTVSRQSRNFLHQAQKSGKVIDICDDLPKSYILTENEDGIRVYISSVSSRTILKRANRRRFADSESTEFSKYI